MIGTPPFGITDPDSGDTKSLTIDCGTHTGYFTMDTSSGQVSYQSDYDLDTGSLPSTVTCTVTVTDSGGLNDTATLTITICTFLYLFHMVVDIGHFCTQQSANHAVCDRLVVMPLAKNTTNSAL